MKDFTDEAWADFEEGMAERFDFKACVRKDGSYYGVPDDSECRTGRESGKDMGDRFDKSHVNFLNYLRSEEFQNWLKTNANGALLMEAGVRSKSIAPEVKDEMFKLIKQAEARRKRVERMKRNKK